MLGVGVAVGARDGVGTGVGDGVEVKVGKGLGEGVDPAVGTASTGIDVDVGDRDAVCARKDQCHVLVGACGRGRGVCVRGIR